MIFILQSAKYKLFSGEKKIPKKFDGIISRKNLMHI